jgi:ribonuclease HII
LASFEVERQILERGCSRIAGVDEAGRGALFGPVVAAAVVLPGCWINAPVEGWLKEVNDSKLLAPAKRKDLAGRIVSAAEAIGIGVATSREIDRQNIYWASLEAMKRAVDNLPLKPDFLLIDGFKSRKEGFACPQLGITGGDRRCLSIAAASIMAKVVRDDMIVLLEGAFEGYHLAKNKGYGTREHYWALRKRGPSALHRLSFNLRG